MYDKAIKFLKNYEYLANKLKVIDNNLIGVKGINFDEKMPSYKTKIDYIQEKEQIVQDMQQIESIVSHINNIYAKQTIEFEYINFMTIKEIAYCTNYSETSVRRFKNEGLKEVEELLKIEKK